MHVTSDTTSHGVRERGFAFEAIPGVVWSPVHATDRAPLVLLVHGGGQHKQAPGILARAKRFVTAGLTAAAIDLPGHGERPMDSHDERAVARIRERAAAGEPLGPQIARHNADLAERALPEWQALLDALRENAGADARAVGVWGLSLGGAIAVTLAAREPRITAVVCGLIGGEAVAETAATITAPVEFLMQWDDELVPRDDALAVFDAFAGEKSLHANAGTHTAVPAFEVDSSERFFLRHLRDGGLPGR